MKYHLTLRKDFEVSRRTRAGVTIPAGAAGVIVELDDEQLAAIKADPEITVREAKQPTTEPKEETAPEKKGSKPKAAPVAERQMVDIQEEKTA